MFSYRFPAVKGRQAHMDYYIAMVPIGLLGRLFPPDEEIVSPEHRAQRRLNTARIPVIRDYVLNNRDSYVFSALSASIDGHFQFHASADTPSLGVLEVDLDSTFLINDGQHRKAALLEAVKEDNSLRDETISVVFFSDQGLSRSQQMFTDLNKHAVKTSNSIAELYDSRDLLAVVTREVVAQVPLFEKYTDKEKDNLGKFSSKLFTLNAIYSANKRILRHIPEPEYDLHIAFLISYWTAVFDNIPEWSQLEEHSLSKKDLRENYILSQSILFQAFGRLGNFFLSDSMPLWNLEGLQKIDWQRSNKEWLLRAIRKNGRIVVNEEAVILTCNLIKKKLGIRLSGDELKKERELEQEPDTNG